MKKWIVLIAGVIMQAILGGIYAWSTFVPSLKNNYGLSSGECGFIFGITIAVFTIAMIPAGRLLSKFGPRRIAMIGAVLFFLGYSLASLSHGSFILLILSLSIITGTGLGFGYVVPLTVGMKWFPHNKGLVTGVAVAGFGGGALLLSSLSEYLLGKLGWDVLEVFGLIGFCFGLVAIASAFFLSEPENLSKQNNNRLKTPIKHYLKSRTFIYIAIGMFAGTFAGLLTISNLKPMALSFGTPENYAVWIISFFAFGNAAGRIIWGEVHDIIGSRITILLSLLLLGLSLTPFLFKLSPIITLTATFICGLGFGACFVVYASSIVENFGVEIFPRLYPVCFLGYGFAGLTGPPIGGWIVDTTNSYVSTVVLSTSIVLFALILISFGLNKDSTKKNEFISAEGESLIES